MTSNKGLSVPSLHNWRYYHIFFDLIWSIRCLMRLILDLNYLKKVWNQISILLTMKPENSSRNNELALCGYEMQQRTKNRQTKENSKLIVAPFYPLKRGCYVYPPSSSYDVTKISYYRFLRHNFANRSWFALVWIGNDVLSWWGVYEKWVTDQAIFQCIKRNWYLRSEQQQYILEMSKSLTCYQNVTYLTRMHCTANNAKAREPQRTGLMPCCTNFSLRKVAVLFSFTFYIIRE